MTTTESPRTADGGPPVDPDSPFREPHAYRTRAAVRRPSARSRLRKLIAWLVALAIVAGAVWAAGPLVGYRLTGISHVSLGTATLTATDIPVPAPGDGQVVAIDVHPSEGVVAGRRLADVRVFGTSAGGGMKTSLVHIDAPISGVVSAIGAPAGSAVQRGGDVVHMYDPAAETFHVNVGMSTVSRLRQGMHATLTSSAVGGSISAIVDHVVAPSGEPPAAPGAPAPASPSQVTVVLRPVRRMDVRSLAPGLLFNAVVDTRTAPRGAPRIVRVVGP